MAESMQTKQGPCAPTPEEELAHYRRLQELDALLPALAGVLDVREVFEKVSEIAKRVLSHDVMVVALLDEGGKAFTLHAIAGGDPHADCASIPQIAFEDAALPAEPWEFEIIDDIKTTEKQFGPTLRAAWERSGLRSLLRVPLRLEGRLHGVLVFRAREPAVYGCCDALVASRIRDHVSLALSHQRLADEARRAAEARERAALAEARVKALTDELAAAGGRGRVIGASRSWMATLEHATKVAPTETTVLVTGESGTGKEVLARLIHGGSRRAQGPFVAINCAALPEALLESELFGFEKGAFSGAVQAKPGRIEQAAHGVLFLDEIGEMSPAVQAKLLRFLQEREFHRLGGARALKADVRVIAATNRDLKAATERGTFREDLYYRVSVFEIRAPALRDRPDDILPLSAAFLDDIAGSLGRPPAGISREARDRLLAYRWPGNVRELRNVLERASILCEGGLIAGEHLAIPADPPRAHRPTATPPNGDEHLGTMERATISRVLAEARFNKSRAAKRLGLSRGQLYQRLKKYGLDDPDAEE